jgi:lipopolysaccharide biosynthesis protein
MRSICFFSSYFIKPDLPYYIRCYLLEIRRHFNEIVFITNDKILSEQDEQFLLKNNIELMLVDNEGYDFGMWYKAFNKFPVHEYERIGLINDSCILFKELNDVFHIIDGNNWDYCGILDSIEIAYHLQSYFIIINRAAISIVRDYFKENGIIKDFDRAILKYEVGLSQHLLQKNFKLGTVYSCKINSTTHNPSFFSIKELSQVGLPLIKKKILFGNYRKQDYLYLKERDFVFNPQLYIELILRTNQKLILNFNQLKKDYDPLRMQLRLYYFDVLYFVYRGFRKLKRFFVR